MNIIDYRNEKYLEWNGPKIIKKLLDYTPSKYLRNINKIILFDTDYKKKGAAGRLVKNKSAYFASIEIMFDTLDKYPEYMISNEITIAFELSDILFHEIYHHRRVLNKLRKLKKDKDENNADLWGRRMTVETLNKIYPKKDLIKFKEEYFKFTKKE
jgi:hypothetical protein